MMCSVVNQCSLLHEDIDFCVVSCLSSFSILEPSKQSIDGYPRPAAKLHKVFPPTVFEAALNGTRDFQIPPLNTKFFSAVWLRPFVPARAALSLIPS